MARSCGEGGVEDWTYFLDCLLMFSYGSLSLFDGSSMLDIGSASSSNFVLKRRAEFLHSLLETADVGRGRNVSHLGEEHFP